MKEYPKYVRMGSSYLRLRGDMYWCDAGEWGVNVRERPRTYDPENFDESTLSSVSHMDSINNKPLFKCDEEDWADHTYQYIPIGYVFEDGSVWDGESADWDNYSEDEDGNMIDLYSKNETNYNYLLIQR